MKALENGADRETAITSGRSRQRKRDPLWWMHPAFRGEQTLEVSDAGVMAQDTMLWVKHADGTREKDGADAIPAEGGPHANLAKLLYKLNNCRPGPVKGWYVVVCVEPDTRWAVGQLRADAARPVQIFEDLVFDSEAAARARAEALRSTETGAGNA